MPDVSPMRNPNHKWFTPGTVMLDGKEVPARIPDPFTRAFVPPLGQWVDPMAKGGYWLQIVRDGDGELSDDMTDAAKAAEARAAARSSASAPAATSGTVISGGKAS